MPNNWLRTISLILALQLFSSSFSVGAEVEKTSYPVMASLDQYLISDEQSEISLARSAAPASIASEAEVMVLRRTGYVSVVKGSNGFVCIVERSWAKPTDDPEFWNSKVSAPTCFNRAAATTFLPIYLTRTKLALAGQSPGQILAASDSAFRGNKLRTLAPGAMCYMMASRQYLSDSDRQWHPHLMFFASGNISKAWGANLPGSPLIAGNDPEEHATVFMMMTDHWSDGTAASPTMH